MTTTRPQRFSFRRLIAAIFVIVAIVAKETVEDRIDLACSLATRPITQSGHETTVSVDGGDTLFLAATSEDSVGARERLAFEEHVRLEQSAVPRV